MINLCYYLLSVSMKMRNVILRPKNEGTFLCNLPFNFKTIMKFPPSAYISFFVLFVSDTQMWTSQIPFAWFESTCAWPVGIHNSCTACFIGGWKGTSLNALVHLLHLSRGHTFPLSRTIYAVSPSSSFGLCFRFLRSAIFCVCTKQYECCTQ